MWFVFALGSAVFAALTSILAKIGIEGVSTELLENGYAKESVDKYLGLFDALADKKNVAEGVGF